MLDHGGKWGAYLISLAVASTLMARRGCSAYHPCAIAPWPSGPDRMRSRGAPFFMTSESDSEAPVHAPVHRRRGVFLLPNIFTTGTLFSGFYAIVAAIDGNFTRAGIAVFVAMLFDGL